MLIYSQTFLLQTSIYDIKTIPSILKLPSTVFKSTLLRILGILLDTRATDNLT